jgi:hypothetical protein
MGAPFNYNYDVDIVFKELVSFSLLSEFFAGMHLEKEERS